LGRQFATAMHQNLGPFHGGKEIQEFVEGSPSLNYVSQFLL